MAESREERDQPQNRKNAFYRLVNKMVEYYRKEESNLTLKTKATATIRTYKLDKGYVKDHRTGKEYRAKDIMNGDLEDLHMEILAGNNDA